MDSSRYYQCDCFNKHCRSIQDERRNSCRFWARLRQIFWRHLLNHWISCDQTYLHWFYHCWICRLRWWLEQLHQGWYDIGFLVPSANWRNYVFYSYYSSDPNRFRSIRVDWKCGAFRGQGNNSVLKQNRILENRRRQRSERDLSYKSIRICGGIRIPVQNGNQLFLPVDKEIHVFLVELELPYCQEGFRLMLETRSIWYGSMIHSVREMIFIQEYASL